MTAVGLITWALAVLLAFAAIFLIVVAIYALIKVIKSKDL